MTFERKTYETRQEKRRDFWIGFAGWFVVNALLAGLITAASSLMSSLNLEGAFGEDVYSILLALLGLLPLLINVGGLIFLGFTRKWMALGALTALGVVLLLVLCAGLLFLGFCFLMQRNP